MPGTAVRLLVGLVVWFAIIDEIRGPTSPPDRSRSMGPFGRFRSGFSGLARALSPRRHDFEAGPSRSRRSRSRSRSRSPSSSSDLQILSSPPPVFRQLQASQPPFPYVTTSVSASTPSQQELINKFIQMHMSPGDTDMTLKDFKAKKNSLLTKLSGDTCDWDIRGGGNKCAVAFKEFKGINSKWRGPCGSALIGMCQPWGYAGRRCSFFMKTSQGYSLPMMGYSHTMQDCVNALSPEDFEKDLNALADSWLEP